MFMTRAKGKEYMIIKYSLLLGEKVPMNGKNYMLIILKCPY